MYRTHVRPSHGLVLLCMAAILSLSAWLAGCGRDSGQPQPAGDTAVPQATPRTSVTAEGDTLILQWQAVPGATGYTVYRAAAPGVSLAQAQAISVQGTGFADAGLAGGNHYYVVAAGNGAGQGPPSQEIGGRPQPAVVGAPFRITAVNGDGQVTLTWPDAAAAKSFVLYVSTTPGVRKDTAQRIAPVSSPYTHGALANGTTYYFALAAINRGGRESPLSGEVSARPMPPPLVPPTGLTAAAGDARVTLTWNPVAGAEGYAIYWGQDAGVTPESGQRIDVTAAPYEHTGLANGTTYHYVLTATNALEESAPTAEVSATPEGTALPDLVVSELSVVSFSETTIRYQYTLTNVGEGPALLDGPTEAEYDNVKVQAFLSADEVFANAGDLPAGGTIIGLSPLGWLAPGESYTGEFQASASVDLVARPYLTLMADWGDVVAESNEDNNTLAVLIQAPQPGTDQAQLVFDTGFVYAVGGGSQQKLAQVVTAGMTGQLTSVGFPIGCAGDLVIQIQGVASDQPDGVVLSETVLPVAVVGGHTSPPSFKTLSLGTPVPVTAGSSFAIVLDSPGSCGLYPGPIGDPYAGGAAFFDSRPNPEGVWVPMSGGRNDLPFRTDVYP